MAHRLEMGNDGFIRVQFFGEIDKISIDFFLNELNPFLNATTPENPLNLLFLADEITKYTSKARKEIFKLNKSPRIGLFCIISATRETKVFFNMLEKSAPESQIGFFENEEEALLQITASNIEE